MQRRYAAGHDPLDFVSYLGDEFGYSKDVYSPAELDAFLAAAIAHLRANGRDVVLLERQPEPEEDA